MEEEEWGSGVEGDDLSTGDGALCDTLPLEEQGAASGPAAPQNATAPAAYAAAQAVLSEAASAAPGGPSARGMARRGDGGGRGRPTLAEIIAALQLSGRPGVACSGGDYAGRAGDASTSATAAAADVAEAADTSSVMVFVDEHSPRNGAVGPGAVELNAGAQPRLRGGATTPSTAIAGYSGGSGVAALVAEGREHGATSLEAQFQSWRLHVQASSLQPRVLHVSPQQQRQQQQQQHVRKHQDGTQQQPVQAGDMPPTPSEDGSSGGSGAATVVAPGRPHATAGGAGPFSAAALRAAFTVTAVPVPASAAPAGAAEAVGPPAAGGGGALGAGEDAPPAALDTGCHRIGVASRLQPQSPPPLEVLFRCGNKYLPIRLCSWRAGDGGSGTSTCGGGNSGVTDAVSVTDALDGQGGASQANDAGGCTVEWVALGTWERGVGLRLQPTAAQPLAAVLGPAAAGGDVDTHAAPAPCRHTALEPEPAGPLHPRPLQLQVELEVELQVDLTELPLRPGLALLDVRCCGRPLMALPVVLTADEAMAGELAAAARCWGRPAAELEELLMDLGTWECHAGAALATAAAAARAGAAAGAARAHRKQRGDMQEDGGDDGDGCGGVAAAALLPLGSHLLQYTRMCGWRLTAAHMRHTLAQLTALARAQQEGQRGRAPVDSADAGAAVMAERLDAAAGEGWGTAAEGAISGIAAESGAAAAASERGGSGPRIAFATRRPHTATSTPEAHAIAAATEGAAGVHSAPCEPTGRARSVLLRQKRQAAAEHQEPETAVNATSGKGKAAGSKQPAQPSTAAARTTAPRGQARQPLLPPEPHWLAAVLVELWLRRPPAGQEAAFAAWSLPSVVAQAQVLHWMEAFALAALLLRAAIDGQVLHVSSISTIVACAPATAILCMRRFMPRDGWARLVSAFRVPRFCVYSLCKALLAFGLIPAPPGIRGFVSGAAQLLMEGVMLGACSMLPPVSTATLMLILQLLHFRVMRVLEAEERGGPLFGEAAARPTGWSGLPGICGSGADSWQCTAMQPLLTFGVGLLTALACRVNLRLRFWRQRGGQQQRDSATSHHAAPWAGAKGLDDDDGTGDDRTGVQTFQSGPLAAVSGSKIPKGLLVPLAARRSDAGSGSGYGRARELPVVVCGDDDDNDGLRTLVVSAAAPGRPPPAGRDGGGRRNYVESDSGATGYQRYDTAARGAQAASCDGVVPQQQQQQQHNRQNRGQQGRMGASGPSFPPSVGPQPPPQPPSPPQQVAAAAGAGGRGRGSAGAGRHTTTDSGRGHAADTSSNKTGNRGAGASARGAAGGVGPAPTLSTHDSNDAAAEAAAIAAAIAAAQAAALEEEAAEERARAEAEAEARVQAELAAGVTWVIRPGPPIESAYQLGRTLGQGSFGVVRAAVHIASGAEVAVKTMRKGLLRAGDIAALRREVEILHHLKGHPHISELLGVFEEPAQLHLVLEMYKGGDLFDAIISVGRHSERAAADVMRTVLTAIAYCHAMGVAHRDIKPENFMLSEDPHAHDDDDDVDDDDAGDDEDRAAARGGAVGSRLKLIDFGLSVFCTDSCALSDTVGTSYYVAPEVLAGCYSRAADVWSAGVILHIMLAGYAPFDGRNDDDILRAILKGNLDMKTDPIWQSISREAVSALTAMLERDPAKRATADQLLAMPWFGRTAAACAAPSAPLPGVVSERMRRFARMNSFKREARRVVAGLMRREEVAGLVAQFRALDVNGDGKLSIQELKEGLARQELRLGGPNARPLTEREVEQLLARSDLDGDGLLDESEFIGATLPAAAITRKAQHALAASSAATAAAARDAAAAARPGSAGGATALLAAAFAHFDTDGSGYITEDELRAALAAHHPGGEGPDIGAIMAQFDIDGDGRIDYDEFLKMMVQADEDEDGEADEETEMLDVSSAPLPADGDDAGVGREAAAAEAAAEAADRVGGCYVGVRPRSARPGNNRITAADVARLAAPAAAPLRPAPPLASAAEAGGEERRGVKSRKVTMAWALGDQVMELEAEGEGEDAWGRRSPGAPPHPPTATDKRSAAAPRAKQPAAKGAAAAAAAAAVAPSQQPGARQGRAAGAGAPMWSDSDDSAEEEVLFGEEEDAGAQDRHSRHSRPSGKAARGRASAASAAAAAAAEAEAAPGVRRDTYVARPGGRPDAGRPTQASAALQPFTSVPAAPAAGVPVVAVAPKPPSAGHAASGGPSGVRPTSRPPALQLPSQPSGGPSRARQQQQQHASGPNPVPHAAPGRAAAEDAADQPIGGGRAASSSSGLAGAYPPRSSPHGAGTAAPRSPASPVGGGAGGMGGASVSGTVGRLARSSMQTGTAGNAHAAPAAHNPYARAHPPTLHQAHPGGPRHHDPVTTIYGGDSSGGSLPGSPSAAAQQRLPGARASGAVPGSSFASASAPIAKLPAAQQPQLVSVQAGRGGGGAAAGVGGAHGPHGGGGASSSHLWTSNTSSSSSPTAASASVAHLARAGMGAGVGGSSACGTRSSGSGARGQGEGAASHHAGGASVPYGDVSDGLGHSEPIPSLGSSARARRQSTGSAWQQQQQQQQQAAPAQAASPPSPHPPSGRLQHSPLHSNPLSPRVPLAAGPGASLGSVTARGGGGGGGGLVAQLQQLQPHPPPLLEEELAAPSPHSGGSASSLRPRGRRASRQDGLGGGVEAPGTGASAELWLLHGSGGAVPPGAAAGDTWMVLEDAGEQPGSSSGLGARRSGGGPRGPGARR
ncbi:hypothetical protein HXX76_013311 [Chlamydomonas incerta]|uniref:Non-specific serine/threonine protein kinase n=1 Tax=Chlamydomonas incerta TaxID=51695 RepID=A0A835VU48_CHLIN|nr:hypothetical protein HXX76_013311 [Chlamydomonas incerta]|eukprot:KAG2425938.1 hypothetical protein HXX76_013311 [Chlamydomonas incerta]